MQTLNKPGDLGQRILKDHMMSGKHPNSTNPFEVGEGDMTMIDTPNNYHDSVNEKSSFQIINAGFGHEETKTYDLNKNCTKDFDFMRKSNKLPPISDHYTENFNSN